MNEVNEHGYFSCYKTYIEIHLFIFVNVIYIIWRTLA